MNGYEMDTNERLENSTWPITKFVAQLRNQLTATQFVRSFENPAPYPLQHASYCHRSTVLYIGSIMQCHTQTHPRLENGHR